MASLVLDAQAARRQLERILESAGFSRNERLSRFLRFVVEGHLDGKDQELKESVIAMRSSDAVRISIPGLIRSCERKPHGCVQG